MEYKCIKCENKFDKEKLIERLNKSENFWFQITCKKCKTKQTVYQQQDASLIIL